ncbi:PAS domain S-box protein [Clostridium sp. YIM B02505]|uniref:histidine kinase n=1 Tax=Clostridium yunnanense TaxID=2800325 RepID=A0ABS1EW36_9CLOT|nr:ATP-binding protein [Clostridium yunnanense]MBK1813513.1 PAS domain S-box protein [Clostridium yunnanense]
MCDGTSVDNDELVFGVESMSDIGNKGYEYFNFLPYATLVQRDDKIVFANDELRKLLHCKDQSILGKSIISLLQLERDRELSNSIDKPFEGEYKIKDFKSNIIDVDIKCNIKQINNCWYEFYIFRDITFEKKKYNAAILKAEKYKNTLEKLFDNKELYKKLIDMLPDGISIHDGSTYSFASSSYARMLGYDNPKDLVGKRLEEVLGKENQEFKKQRIEDLLSEEKVFLRNEYQYINSQGITKHFESTSVRFLHNNKVNILSSVRDITDKKRVEESKLLLERAIEDDKLKTEFFSNMSHELRTPLNILLSSLQLISMYTDTNENSNLPAVRKYTGIMKQNCYRLLRLINNLLDITKIDSGFYKLNMHNQDIVKVVEDITLSVAEYVKEKGIEIIFDTDIEEKILAFDADKIERVILNLLSNAVKFTKSSGKIEVSIKELVDAIYITVRDTGSGIPKDKLNNIFDRFIQVDKSLSKRSEGTGIGLSLVKSLVDMHGGNISVESEYGQYTQFNIVLPAKVLAAENESGLSRAAINNDLDDKKVERMSIEFSDIYL